MEDSLGIFKGIVKSDFLNLYLDTIKENQSFRGKSTSETDEIILTINGFLTKQKTRKLGLQLLKYYLPQCSQDKFEQKVNFWCIHVLKACNVVEMLQYSYLIYDVFEILAKNCYNSPDLSKVFSSAHLTKIYDSLNLVPSIEQISVLSCIKTCLELYPGPSAQSQSLIERILYENAEATDKQIIYLVGVCRLLLLHVRRNVTHGGTFKTQWYNYHVNLIKKSNLILNKLFEKHLPICKLNAEEEKSEELIEFNKGPVNSIGQLYLRFHNVIHYNIIAIRAPFPASKRIMPKKILSLIQRGLSVTTNQLTQSGVFDNMVLAAFIPNIQLDLLELLESIILTLGCHLKSHASFIMDLLTGTLIWTSAVQSGSDLKRPQSNLRMKAYGIIILWCETLQHGSFCEYHAERLIAEIFTDTCPSKLEITLKVLSGTRKHLSKKARRQLNKAQNEQSRIGQIKSNHGCTQNESCVQNENADLCVIAQRCLQQILISSSSFLKPTLIKTVQIKLLQTCSLFTELPMNSSHLYFSGRCRIEIYNSLKIILLTRHHLTPPSVEMIYSTIRSAQFYDKNPIVRNHCGIILKNLEHFIHPEKEGLVFSVDMNNFRKSIEMTEEFCVQNNFINEVERPCDHTESDEYNSEPSYEKINKNILVSLDSSSRTNDDFTEDDYRSTTTIKPTTTTTTTTKDLMNTLELKETLSTNACLHNKNNGDTKIDSNILCTQRVNEISANNSSEEIQYEPSSKKLKSSCSLNNSNTNCTIVNDDELLAEIQSSFVDELA